MITLTCLHCNDNYCSEGGSSTEKIYCPFIMSYGDNIVVNGTYRCKVAIENSGKEILGNVLALLNVLNRFTLRICLLLGSV